jgi:hypothetical protein
MVEILESCGVGRVINCICGYTIFIVHPDAPIDVESNVAKAFHGVFGYRFHFTLQEILCLFDGRRSLSEVIKGMTSSTQEYAIDIVVWLLRFIFSFMHQVFLRKIIIVIYIDGI